MKKRILFLCTGNSCRSQMAEGFAKHFKSDVFDIYSAGTEKHGLNQNAVKVMKEVGIDISQNYSKTVNDIENKEFDFVITVCGDANENCPYFPAKTKVMHVGFEDPPKLAKELKEKGASEEEQLDEYRKIRDKIEKFTEKLEEFLDE